MHDELYIEYIQKELLDTISDAETIELNSWKNKSEDNLQLYENIIKAWEASSSYGSDLNIDVEKDYEIVKKRMDTVIHKESFVKTIFPFLAIAASLIFFVSILILWNSSDSEGRNILAQIDNQKVSLPDGSIIHLSKGSQVTYKGSFEKVRTIELLGSAHFSISHNAEKPFQVISPHLMTTVLGTEFILSDDDNAEMPQVQLLEGSVRVEHRVSNSEVVLRPNQMATVEDEELRVADYLDPTKSEWFYGELHFQNTPLVEVIEEIKIRYGIEILVDDALLNCSFSADLKGRTINQIVKAITLVYSASIDEAKSDYHIIGGACQ